MIRSATRTWAQLGVLNGTLYLLGEALRRLSGGRVRLVRYLLVAQPVPRPFLPACRPAANVRIEHVAPGAALPTALPRPAEVLADRLERQRCEGWLLWSGDRLAGCIWLAFGGYDEDEVRCRFELDDPQRCAWDFDVHVEPAFRLGRSFARLWDAANAELARRDMHWSLSRISAFNPESLAAHRRLGLAPLGSATFLCAGTLQLAVFGQAPYLHIGLGPAQRPTLRLRAPDRSDATPKRQ